MNDNEVWIATLGPCLLNIQGVPKKTIHFIPVMQILPKVNNVLKDSATKFT